MPLRRRARSGAMRCGPCEEQAREPVFSRSGAREHALGLETIYEGYLVHYGRSRLFAPADRDTALLLGDYLYAHGLVRIAESGDVRAVADLAELISRCAQLRAEGQRRRRGRMGGDVDVARSQATWSRALPGGRRRACRARPARRIESPRCSRLPEPPRPGARKRRTRPRPRKAATSSSRCSSSA